MINVFLNTQTSRWVALQDGKELASVLVERQGNALYIQDPQIADSGGFKAILRQIKATSAKADIFFPIADEPHHDVLRKILSRLGAKKYIELWRLSND